KALGAFLLSVSRQGVIYFLVILAASTMFGYTGVIVSQSISDILTAVLAVVLFRREIYREM
ncbi:MAG: MATE family efflux transporter, partial [Hominisplanchenecus sp.]